MSPPDKFWSFQNMGYAPVIAVFMTLAPILSVQKALVMSPILALSSFVILSTSWRRLRIPIDRYFIAIIGAGLVWCAVSSFWSFDTVFSLINVLMLVGSVFIGLIFVEGFRQLDPKQQQMVVLGLTIGLIVTAVIALSLGVIERTGLLKNLLSNEAFGQVHNRLNRMARTATILALLVWPTAAWLVRLGRPKLAVIVLILVVPAVFISFDLAAKSALLAGALVWGAARIRLGFTSIALAVIMVATILCSPLASRHLPDSSVSAQWSWLPSSAHHRLTIWTFVGQHIVQKPLFGWGFESSRDIPGGKDELVVVRHGACEVPSHQNMIAVEGLADPVPFNCIAREPRLPLHPHDAWLQIWLELGVVGTLLAAALLWRIATSVRRSAKGQRGSAALALATTTSAFVISSVAFGTWQNWWLCSIWVAVALTAPLLTPRDTPPLTDSQPA